MATPASTTFTGPQYYDGYIGPLWFGPFGDALAGRLPPDTAGDVLEIACGTGLLTRPLRARLPPARRLVATDLSQPMLDYARQRLRDVPGIEWREADALHLPFDDGVFAVAACAFGFMFLPDRLAGLKEARRVLAPGGTLLFSVWDKIENNPHMLTNAQVLEAMFPGDAEMRFRVPFEMHDVGDLRDLVARAGFEEPAIETLCIPIQGADPLRIAEGLIRGTPRSALIAQRGVALDLVIGKVAAALAAAGGKPYSSYAQGQLVVARAA